jgi:hypothetical protein
MAGLTGSTQRPYTASQVHFRPVLRDIPPGRWEMSDERESTVSKTVLPVGESTRELWGLIDDVGKAWTPMTTATMNAVIEILADADARDPFAVANLLYAWRTGQLA